MEFEANGGAELDASLIAIGITYVYLCHFSQKA